VTTIVVTRERPSIQAGSPVSVGSSSRSAMYAIRPMPLTSVAAPNATRKITGSIPK
jgi:hypothetical protein